MTKSYVELPQNFNDIEKYLVVGTNEILSKIVCGKNYYFYDTCSVLNHSGANSREYIISYLKSKDTLIVITRTVLMELSSGVDNKIHPVQINYLKEMYDSSLDIILIDEEIVLSCLTEVINITTLEANKLLGYAVKELSRAKGKIYELIHADPKKIISKLISPSPGNKELYADFFKYARSTKESKDNLGEELMFICFIILTKAMPLGKCIFFSNDLKSMGTVIQLKDYIVKFHGKKEPYQLTTAALVYKMYKDNILKDRNKMIDILAIGPGQKVKIFYVGEDDISLQEASFSIEDLVDKIIADKHFVVVY